MNTRLLGFVLILALALALPCAADPPSSSGPASNVYATNAPDGVPIQETWRITRIADGRAANLFISMRFPPIEL